MLIVSGPKNQLGTCKDNVNSKSTVHAVYMKKNIGEDGTASG